MMTPEEEAIVDLAVQGGVLKIKHLQAQVADLTARLASAAEEIERLRVRTWEKVPIQEENERLKADALLRTEACGKLNDEIHALKAAVEQARRETASDPDNRWCRNATIILNAALTSQAAGGRRE